MLKFGDGESGDLGDSHPGEIETEHDLVTQADDGAVLAGSDELTEGLVVGQPAAGVLGLDLAERPAVIAGGLRVRVPGQEVVEQGGQCAPIGGEPGGSP